MKRRDDEDLTPLARAMKSQKRPHKTIDFPGMNGLKVAIVVPSDEEIAEAQAAALQYLTAGLKLDEFKLSIMLERNLYEAEEQRQLLACVLRDPADVDASFGTIDDLRQYLTPDTRKILLRHLAAFTEARSPEKRFDGDPKKVEEFVRDLKDSGALSEYLTSCDFATLVTIGLSLAEALPPRTKPSSTDTFNSNSPSDSSSDPETKTTE
jgi:hypothetical protein